MSSPAITGVVLCTILGGCAATPTPPPEAAPAADPLAALPEDLTIDVMIVTGRRARELTGVERQPSHLILFPDGSLRAEWGSSIGPDVRPAVTRTLKQEEVADLWSQAQQLGLAHAAAGVEPANPELVVAGPDEFVQTLIFRAAGERWMFQRRHSRDDQPDDGISLFIRTLAGIAWGDDLRGHHVVQAPPRYDFGPDPYARYRQERPSAIDEESPR